MFVPPQELPEGVSVTVHDSTADCRCMYYYANYLTIENTTITIFAR